jgi:Probable N6-adenine methyltransferase
MKTQREDLKQRLTELMATGPREPFFDEAVSDTNRLWQPDFTLSQFFFTNETVTLMVQAFDGYSKPCCLCTPRLAYEWSQRGRSVILLDIDERFRAFADFVRFDLRSPRRVDREFDVVIADPPFFLAKPVYDAIRVLLGDQRPDLFLVFAVEKEEELLRLFSEYGLKRTAFDLRHCNVKASYQHLFRLYGTRPAIFSRSSDQSSDGASPKRWS